MSNVEERDLGRRIDCAALVTGLRTLKANPGLRLAINMSARSIGYPKWMGILRRFSRNHPDVVEAPDPRDHGKLGHADARDRHRLHGGVARQGCHLSRWTISAPDPTAFRHLKHFCFDILKIDGQFARSVDDDPDNQVVTEALIRWAAISTCWSWPNPSRPRPRRSGWPRPGSTACRGISLPSPRSSRPGKHPPRS